MSNYLMLLCLFPMISYGLNSSLVKDTKILDDYGVSISVEYAEWNKCYWFKVTSPDDIHFGEEGKKKFSGFSYVKNSTDVNPYKLVDSPFRLSLESKRTLKGNKLVYACIPKEEISSSYIVLNYFREQSCSEVIHIPAAFLLEMYGK